MDEFFYTSPVFDSFTLELKSEIASDFAAAASQVLEIGLEAWRIEPVHPSRPRAFDVLPPAGTEVSVKRAWDLAHQMRLHPNVAEAEPVFEVLQDNVPDPSEVTLDAVPAELRRAVLAADEDEDGEAAAALEAASPLGPASLSESDPEWSPKLVQAPQAWQRTPPGGGVQRGRGIRIAHPDSGFRRHSELFSDGDERVLLDHDRNFVERDRPDDAESDEGGHGLGTASVIMSLDNETQGPAVVTGTAPAADIVPMRVAKKRFGVPVPVLLSSGARRLREAIYAAIDAECHVVSISLGWLWNSSLHEAVKQAVRENIIVCAAAGNYVRFVVWPAHYPETIAVAGCTARRRKWRGSSRGKQVDVTAPAKNVWKATVTGSGNTEVKQSKGTSFSVATTAGLAALWLAHWGRDFLIERYQGEFTLTTVFRRLLKATCDPPPPRHRGRFGAGIVNADRLLAADLPTLDEMRASTAPSLEAAMADISAPAGRHLRSFTDVFEAKPPAAMRRELAGLLDIPAEDLNRQLPAIGDELLFHLVTQPSLRESFLLEPEELPVASGALLDGILIPEEAPPAVDARARLLGLEDLSDRLRDTAE